MQAIVRRHIDLVGQVTCERDTEDSSGNVCNLAFAPVHKFEGIRCQIDIGQFA